MSTPRTACHEHSGGVRIRRNTWRIGAYLELGEREPTSEAHARAVDERKEVAVALDLLRLLGQARGVEPALGAELCCIRPPERLIPVMIIERNADYRARLEMLSEDVRAALRNLPRQSGPDR